MVTGGNDADVNHDTDHDNDIDCYSSYHNDVDKENANGNNAAMNGDTQDGGYITAIIAVYRKRMKGISDQTKFICNVTSVSVLRMIQNNCHNAPRNI